MDSFSIDIESQSHIPQSPARRHQISATTPTLASRQSYGNISDRETHFEIPTPSGHFLTPHITACTNSNSTQPEVQVQSNTLLFTPDFDPHQPPAPPRARTPVFSWSREHSVRFSKYPFNEDYESRGPIYKLLHSAPFYYITVTVKGALPFFCFFGIMFFFIYYHHFNNKLLTYYNYSHGW